jgi:hypothetical protein
MNNKWICTLLLFWLFGCNTDLAEESESVQGEDTETTTDSTVANEPAGAIWKYIYNEESDEFEIRQLRPVDSERLSGPILEQIINSTWPDVQIKYIATSNDTAFIAIPDSQVLTQQMGSAGSESFMISTTYSFTELKGVRYVSFSFIEGDHAMPGVYHRNSWKRTFKP